LRNEEGKFILAGTVELAKLYASNFSANVGSQVLDYSVVLQKVWEFGVGIFAVLIRIERLVGWVFDIVPVFR
jgi:hypothetical protein